MKYYIFDTKRCYLGTCETEQEIKSGDDVFLNGVPFKVIRIENTDFLVVEEL